MASNWPRLTMARKKKSYSVRVSEATYRRLIDYAVREGITLVAAANRILATAEQLNAP
jgi:hypothetical protein